MTMQRFEYLTGAILMYGSVSDDYADLVAQPDDERITAALKSGFTKALFNGIVATKFAREPELMLDLLLSINRNAGQPDEWRVIEEGQIGIDDTLLMLQTELVTSAAFCGRAAIPLLTEALSTDNDVLHFGVLHGVAASQDHSFAALIESYKSNLNNRAVNADSKSHLYDAANDALTACDPFQLL